MASTRKPGWVLCSTGPPLHCDLFGRMKSQSSFQRFAALLCVCLGVSRLMASAPPAGATHRGGAGMIAGVVANQATGDLLEGARIQLADTAGGTSSERGGTFFLSAPAGAQTLVVSYSGLEATRVPVVVTAGSTSRVEIELTSKIYMLEKFTVSGLREGQALAIQRQSQAENARTVAATDNFGNPAANPGELLMRLPGVAVNFVSGEAVEIFVRGMGTSFISLMTDGNGLASSVGTSSSRDFQLTALDTGNIESAEIVRAPTPDMPANAIAGYLNLISKRGFDRRGRRLDLTLGTRWTDLYEGKSPSKDTAQLDLVTLNFSDVYSVRGGTRNLGVAFNASHRSAATLTDAVGGIGAAAAAAGHVLPTAANGLASPLLRAMGSGETYAPTHKQNVGLNLDYKLGERSFVYLKNSLNLNVTPEVASIYRQSTSTTAAVASFEAGSTYDFQRALPIAVSRSEVFSGQSRKKALTFAASTGFEHKLEAGAGLVTFDASYSRAVTWYPINADLTADLTGIGWQIDRRGQPAWYPAFVQTAGPSIYSPDSYTPRTFIRRAYRAPAERIGLRLDFRRNVATTVPAYWKVGARHEMDRREQDTDLENYTYTGPRGLAPFLGAHFKQAAGHYGPFPFLLAPGAGGPNDLAARPDLWTQTAADAYNSVTSTLQGDARFEESVDAAFAMGGVTLGAVRLMGGVRAERTKNEGTSSRRRTSAAAGTTSIASLLPAQNAARARAQFSAGQFTSTGGYANVFPGLHVVAEPWRRLQLRASYHASITRPAVGSLLPTTNVNEDTRLVTAGNPELRPYTADNFEVAVQKYFEPVGLFEVSAFLKEISNYTRSIDSVVLGGADNGFEGQFTGYTLRQVRNTGSARIRGFEVSYQQQYTFLPRFWRGLGSFANFSYTQAEGNFGGTTFQRQLANQRPRTANAGLSYAGHGAQVRVLGNWNDRYYRSGEGSTSVYSDPRLIVDFKAQYRINRRVEIYLDVLNLTNEFNQTFVREGGLKYNAQKQGTLYATGVKLTY
ncbi:MAG: TonB-dependent receptor [Opitutus sp.]|nr:TonB-dependent receptor [Opitutus sp.]